MRLCLPLVLRPISVGKLFLHTVLFGASAASIGTITVRVSRAEDGPQFRFATVDVQSSVSTIDLSYVRDKLRT
jgi:hypothetical protein